jgi:hypothetical protein
LWTLYLKKLFYLIIVNVKWQYTRPYFLLEDTVHLIRNDKMSQYTLTFARLLAKRKKEVMLKFSFNLQFEVSQP